MTAITTKTASFLSRATFAILPLIALVACAPAANAQAGLSFTGGNGSPLTLTLTAPVTYTITTAGSFVPFFVFDNVANITNGSSALGSGTIRFSVNGGADRTLDSVRSGLNVGSVTATDILLQSDRNNTQYINLAANSTITLKAGTFTLSSSYAGAPPADQVVTTWITHNNANRISSNGVSTAATTVAPEPGSIALLLTAGLPVVGLVRRKRRDIGK